MIVRSPLLRHPCAPNILLKAENLQPFGSYKIRGVSEAVRSAPLETLRAGLRAASAGNMAQAVAHLAKVFEVPCQIYVPDSAPEVKKQAIRNLGAELIERPFQEVWNLVRHPPRDLSGLFIHPVFTPGLLAGYGTIATELLEDRPRLGAVVIPFGVGGLTLGVARALKNLRPDILVYTCEPETAAPLKASLVAGSPQRVERKPSFIDAIGTPEVLPEVFDLVRPLITDSVVVSLAETRSAMMSLASDCKLICEGAAAASFAAALRLTAEEPDLEVACILSGGNIALSEILLAK